MLLFDAIIKVVHGFLHLFYCITCSMHAREWATAATCTWIIDQLANGYGSDPEITALVDQYDWKFVPITNPDGYNYTWTTVIYYFYF